eukprot:s581_g19.t1
MQGCQDAEQHDSQHENSAWVMFATAFLGFAISLFCRWISGRHVLRADQLEPDAEPDSSGHVADTSSHEATTATTAAAVCQPPQTEPIPEGYIAWLIERCERRCNGAATRERRVLYGARITILHGLRFALVSGSDSLRRAAMQTLANMSDISDDDSFPNFAAINSPTSLRQTSRAVNFIASLQSGGTSSSSFSTNVDMAHNALLRRIDIRAARNERAENEARPEEISDEEPRVETNEELRRRYLSSGQEVSFRS